MFAKPEWDGGRMGWLRDLMRGASPPVPSYGVLARGALASAVWTGEPRPQARSLAALFSRFDRGLDLDWLAERPHAQLALAEVLRCAPGVVREALGDEQPTRHGAASPLRLEDLRFGRALDLSSEPLCPGFPAEVLDPRRWGRLYWVAPAGSGKTLAGRWLEARGEAVYLRGERWNDVARRLPPRRPAFVELASAVDLPEPPESAPPLCIASPYSVVPAPFVRVDTPPVASFIDALVAWVGERVAPDGHFEPERARAWFANQAASGVVDSLGCALGLCGALDELELRKTKGSLRELAQHAFAQRVAETVTRETSEAAWLRRHGIEVLVGLARRLLTDTRETWSAARPLEDWMSLVPPEHQREVDVDWLRVTLADDRGPIREADVRRAAQRLPPGSYRILRGLRAARLLVEAGPDAFALRPHWLWRVAIHLATVELVHGSPFEYGEALLAPHAAESMALALERRILEEEAAPLDEVTEAEAEENPAFVAALETVVRGAGLALLAGHELPHDSLEALWEEQARLIVRCGDEPPAPRIGHQAPPGGLLDVWTWRLALLALSEEVGTATDAWLAPWRRRAPTPELVTTLDALAQRLTHYGAERAHHVYALVDRLRQALGQLAEPPHALEAPAALLDAAELGVLTFDLVLALRAGPHALGALHELLRRRRRAFADVAVACWHAWTAVDLPVSHLTSLRDAAGAARGESLWPHVPPELLTPALVARFDEVDAAAWTDDRLERLLDCSPGLPPRAHATLWQTVPERWAERALRAAPPADVIAAQSTWSRFGSVVLATLHDLLAQAPPAALAVLLEAAPPDQTGALVRHLGAVPRDALDDRKLDLLRAWLLKQVTRRAPGFVGAYELLAQIERELGHARGAR